jgi:hypothetical protein
MNFETSLNKFVDSGFNRAASYYAGADFASGTGGVVNNGSWAAHAHGNSHRVANFDRIVEVLRGAGMDTC